MDKKTETNQDEQDKRINAVIDEAEDEMEEFHAWFEYLESNLEIPCEVIYREFSRRGIPQGAKITLIGIIDTEDLYGVIASGKYQRKAIDFPLCAVTPANLTPENQALDDYAVWFANR
ncbi:MAG: hypothetical protein JJT94_00755 [Bernardetiaceae bacterium]|nr:hypothetical protein [Bernardetiaceae bacterium]